MAQPKLACLLVCGVLFFAMDHSWAQSSVQDTDSFPSRQVRIVVPFVTGGPNDVLGRLLALKLSERWKRPVIVENRPGAGSNIGMDAVAKAPPDGYTIMVTGTTYMINPSLYKQLPFDPIKDFERISILATSPNFLVAHTSVPAKTTKELIALAKASPGKLGYASSGTGSSGHISMELLKYEAGVDITHIPYKGAGDAANALVAGHVQLQITAPASVMPHVKSGRVVVLGVTSLNRLTAFPDVPTIAESGLPGFDISGIYVALAPGKTPKPIVNKLNGEIVQILKMPDVRERIASLSLEIVGSTPEEFTAVTVADIAKYAKAIKAAGIQPE